MTVKTSDPLVSPVTAQELADYAVLDAADPAIPSVLLIATDAVIQFLGYDLTPRNWVLTLWDWPHTGTKTSPNLYPSVHSLDRVIPLPYAALVSVTSVEAYGVATTDYVAREDMIVLNRGIPRDEYQDNADPALVVEYNAGLSPIPEAVRQAILAMGAYLYEHRGACDVTDALKASGANRMLQPYVNPRNVVVF